MTDRKQLFIRTHIHKVPAAVYTISRAAGPSIFVSPTLQSPRKIPSVPGQRKDYCFPICCPVQTQPYQSKPGQLLFHILLMYWKAFHSRLPLISGPEQVSVPQVPQWRTIRLFCWIRKKGGGREGRGGEKAPGG